MSSGTVHVILGSSSLIATGTLRPYPAVVVELESVDLLSVGANTIAIRTSDIKGMAHIHSSDDTIESTQLHGTRYEGLAWRCGEAPDGVAPRELLYLLPTYLVRRDGEDTNDGAANLTIYAQVRFDAGDALFVRVCKPPAGMEWVPSSRRCLDEVLRLAAPERRDNALFYGNHQAYYSKLLPEYELEAKYNLREDSDIWSLMAQAYGCIAGGKLDPMIAEFRDEIQLWDFPTRLYETTGPGEQGYISFIATHDRKVRIKRKVFEADAELRRESISGYVDLQGSTEQYVSERFGISYRKLPAIRRVRYDVNFESLDTGHVYGIFFDRVSVIGAPDISLAQCEIEYLRSRRRDPGAVETMLAEFRYVTTSFEHHLLATEADGYERTNYSKLSFLRDVLNGGRCDPDPSHGILD